MAVPLNLANIQGDILVGLPKQTQSFFFFEILDVPSFRSQLSKLVPFITTAEQAQSDRSDIRKFKVQAREQVTEGDGETSHPGTLPVAGVNLAFSAKGIEKLIATGTNDIGDTLFANGQLADAKSLGDKAAKNEGGTEYKPDWDPTFLQEIHGVFLITGDCHNTLDKKLDEVKATLSSEGTSSVKEIATLVGDVRPGEFRGHEHFGYKDGISQPAVEGVDNALPGQNTVKQGVVLLGREGDVERPTWALDGSFLAFRKLPQLVPEFDNFIKLHAPAVPNDPTADTVGLLGARLVGRWKSGAPIAEAMIRDDPELANDPQRNNNFSFAKEEQDVCPFAAHIRKMNPRGSLTNGTISSFMTPRRGIPFGPEVTEEEKASGVSDPQHERGLYFVSYQSNLSKGFAFLQKTWANVQEFPPRDINKKEVPGEDAIIGQTITEEKRIVTGFDKQDTSLPLTLESQWVNSKGGEYFFSPSIPCLRDTIATASPITQRHCRGEYN